MKNTYYSFKLFICFCFFVGLSYGQSQDRLLQNKSPQQIENLSIYPNPVTNGKLFITTRQNLTKQIEVYDVLGKKVMATQMQGKELSISELRSGVYILKIREGNASATRKLVVR